jgi:ADP-ribose pyrophosphatase
MNVTWKKRAERAERVGFRRLQIRTFELPNGKEDDFTIVDYRPGAALVIALTPEGKFIVAREFRPGPERVMYELPGGFIDKSEDPKDAAAREFREETGYACDNLEFLGKMARDAYVDGDYYYYLARDCKLVDEFPERGEHEFIEVVEITVEEMLDNVVNARITDPGGALLALRKLGL